MSRPTTVPAGYVSGMADGSTPVSMNATTGALLVDNIPAALSLLASGQVSSLNNVGNAAAGNVVTGAPLGKFIVINALSSIGTATLAQLYIATATGNNTTAAYTGSNATYLISCANINALQFWGNSGTSVLTWQVWG